ncbi:MAG: cation transporter [Bdellovibrionota bacterium]
MKKTVFNIPKMDCPSEEKLIRMALAGVKGIEHLKFDLQSRALTAFHEEDASAILNKLEPLNFGAVIANFGDMNEIEVNLLLAEKAKASGQEKDELGVLKILLMINAIMFIAEIILGIVAQSTGLIADAMDMFADAAVYGISLYAVGKAVSLQKKSAQFSGYAQLGLALFALAEVIRSFVFGSEPEPGYMMIVSVVALIANVVCLVLINNHRSAGVHMKASAIFSANDVIANCGVIIAGALVSWTGSRIPDLVVGFFIALVVFRGALAILKISAEPKQKAEVVG